MSELTADETSLLSQRFQALTAASNTIHNSTVLLDILEYVIPGAVSPQISEQEFTTRNKGGIVHMNDVSLILSDAKLRHRQAMASQELQIDRLYLELDTEQVEMQEVLGDNELVVACCEIGVVLPPLLHRVREDYEDEDDDTKTQSTDSANDVCLPDTKRDSTIVLGQLEGEPTVELTAQAKRRSLASFAPLPFRPSGTYDGNPSMSHSPRTEGLVEQEEARAALLQELCEIVETEYDEEAEVDYADEEAVPKTSLAKSTFTKSLRGNLMAGLGRSGIKGSGFLNSKDHRGSSTGSFRKVGDGTPFTQNRVVWSTNLTRRTLGATQDRKNRQRNAYHPPQVSQGVSRDARSLVSSGATSILAGSLHAQVILSRRLKKSCVRPLPVPLPIPRFYEQRKKAQQGPTAQEKYWAEYQNRLKTGANQERRDSLGGRSNDGQDSVILTRVGLDDTVLGERPNSPFLTPMRCRLSDLHVRNADIPQGASSGGMTQTQLNSGVPSGRQGSSVRHVSILSTSLGDDQLARNFSSQRRSSNKKQVDSPQPMHSLRAYLGKVSHKQTSDLGTTHQRSADHQSSWVQSTSTDIIPLSVTPRDNVVKMDALDPLELSKIPQDPTHLQGRTPPLGSSDNGGDRSHLLEGNATRTVKQILSNDRKIHDPKLRAAPVALSRLLTAIADESSQWRRVEVNDLKIATQKISPYNR